MRARAEYYRLLVAVLVPFPQRIHGRLYVRATRVTIFVNCPLEDEHVRHGGSEVVVRDNMQRIVGGYTKYLTGIFGIFRYKVMKIDYPHCCIKEIASAP
jgi:hypothetical protein